MPNTIDITHDKESWLTVKEAAKFTGKTTHTIKKLVQSNKVKNKKVEGKYGLETRILKSSLNDIYNIKEDTPSKDNKKHNNTSANNPSNTSDITQGIEREYINSLKAEIDSLRYELKERNEQIKDLQTIVKNQQTLSLQQNENQTRLIDDPKTKENRKKKLFGLF